MTLTEVTEGIDQMDSNSSEEMTSDSSEDEM